VECEYQYNQSVVCQIQGVNKQPEKFLEIFTVCSLHSFDHIFFDNLQCFGFNIFSYLLKNANFVPYFANHLRVISDILHLMSEVLFDAGLAELELTVVRGNAVFDLRCEQLRRLCDLVALLDDL
jgi:hypothetical protein